MPMLRYTRGVTLGAILLLTPTLALEQQPAAGAGPTPARTLLVLSKADQTLAIVDPTMLVVLGAGKGVVPSNVNSATVTVIEARTVTPPGSGVPRVEWLETVIPVDRGPEGIDVSPDGHDAWVANAQDGTISLIDLEHKRLRGILSVDVKGANRLKFTPDGRRVIASPLSGPEGPVLRALTGMWVEPL